MSISRKFKSSHSVEQFHTVIGAAVAAAVVVAVVVAVAVAVAVCGL